MITKDTKFRDMNAGEKIGVVVGVVIAGGITIAVCAIVLGLLGRAVIAVWS